MKVTTERLCSFLGFIAASTLLGACSTTVPAPVADRVAPQNVEQAVPSKPEQALPAGQARNNTYTVKKGDTLYSIARGVGRNPKDIAAWNNLDNPAAIRVGQVLRTAPPDGAAAAAEVKPIAGQGEVVAKPLGGPSVVGAAAALPPVANDINLKREPKGGKQPYSEQTLAAMQKSEALPTHPVEPATAPHASEAKAEEKAEIKAPPAKPSENDSGMEWIWPGKGRLISQFSEPANKGIDIAGHNGEPVLAAASGKVMYVGSGIRGYGNLVIIKHNGNFLSAYGHNRVILVKENQSVRRGQKIGEIGISDADQPKLHFEIRRQGKPIDPLKYLPAR